ncbi:hypothetical protein RRG08_018120, partial [Elysia crispata]
GGRRWAAGLRSPGQADRVFSGLFAKSRDYRAASDLRELATGAGGTTSKAH